MKKKKFSYDDILAETGMFGPKQIQIYVLLLFPILFVAMFSAQYVFNAGTVAYRCKVPECEETPPKWETGQWGTWALPDEKRRRCQRWAPRVPYGLGRCSPGNFDNTTAVACDDWVYVSYHTVVSEFNLGCSEWKRTLIGTIHAAGVFFALPFVGFISDTFGRRKALVITAMSGGLMGLIRSISTTYVMYLVFEFLDAFLCSGSFQTSFVLALEMVDINWRVCFGNAAASTFAIGQITLSLIAWAVPDWRTMTRLIYAPAIFFFLYHWLIEESARWLLIMGQKHKAAKIIFKFANANNKKLSPALVKYLTSEEHEAKTLEESTSEQNKSLFKKVIRSRVIKIRLLICSFWWVVVTLIYYGLSVNSVTLAGNGYINFILTALVEIPGYLLGAVTLDRFGRKRCMMVAYFVCGLALVIMPFVHDSTVVLCLNLVGKFCISMVFGSLYIYTLELFPTEGRASFIAFCSMVGRVGSMSAPQTPLLQEITPSLPYLVFGALAACACALTTLTPETLRVRLPDTIEQAEALAMKPETDKPKDISLST